MNWARSNQPYIKWKIKRVSVLPIDVSLRVTCSSPHESSPHIQLKRYTLSFSKSNALFCRLKPSTQRILNNSLSKTPFLNELNVIHL